MTDENDRETEARLTRVPASMAVAIGVLVAGALAVGCWPAVASTATGAAQRFTGTAGYVAQALHGAPARPLPSPADTGWTLESVLLDLVSVALAIVIAAAALYPSWAEGPVRRIGAPARAALSVLRRVHSGHVGDYLAWLVFGVAAILVIVGAPVLA